MKKAMCLLAAWVLMCAAAQAAPVRTVYAVQPNGLVWFEQGGLYGLQTAAGEVLAQPQYEAVEPFREGQAEVRRSGQWGAVDEQANAIIPCEYSELYYDPDVDMYYAQYGDFGHGLVVGCMDREGRVVLPMEYAQDLRIYAEGIITMKPKEGMGVIRADGAVICPFEADSIAAPQDGMFLLEAEDGYRFISVDGVAMDAVFDYALPFSQGRAVIADENGFGVIDKQGRTVAACRWDDTGGWYAEGLLAMCEEGLWGYIDLDGNMAISPQFERAGMFACGLAPVRVDGLYGYIDRSGVLRIAPQYSYADAFDHNGYARVERADGSAGLIDTSGRPISQQWYEDCRYFSGGLAAVQLQGEWGFINTDGQMVIPPQFSQVRFFDDSGFCSVYTSDGWHYINMLGELIC